MSDVVVPVTTPAALRDAPGARRFVRDQWLETLASVVAAAVFFGVLSVLSIPWWTIRAARLRRASRARWRPASGPDGIPVPTGLRVADPAVMPRPSGDEVGLLRARADEWVPAAERAETTGETWFVLVHHGADRPPQSPCGIFGSDGTPIGRLEPLWLGCRILTLDGEVVAHTPSREATKQERRQQAQRPWRSYRRRRFCLLTTGSEIVAVAVLDQQSNGGRTLMVILSETLTSPSLQWLAVLDCCKAVGLPVPIPTPD